MDYKQINIVSFWLLILLQSCNFQDEEITYQERMVVFATISANLPIVDTVLVSKTAALDEDILSDNLWVDDAEVTLIRINDDSTDGEKLHYKHVGPGKYFPLDIASSQDEYLFYSNYIK